MSPEALAAGMTTAASDGGVCQLLTVRYAPSSSADYAVRATATCYTFFNNFGVAISYIYLSFVYFVYFIVNSVSALAVLFIIILIFCKERSFSLFDNNYYYNNFNIIYKLFCFIFFPPSFLLVQHYWCFFYLLYYWYNCAA